MQSGMQLHGEDLWWCIVYQREILGFTYKDIAKKPECRASTVWRRVKQFQEGSVVAKKNEGNRKMSDLK